MPPPPPPIRILGILGLAHQDSGPSRSFQANLSQPEPLAPNPDICIHEATSSQTPQPLNSPSKHTSRREIARLQGIARFSQPPVVDLLHDALPWRVVSPHCHRPFWGWALSSPLSLGAVGCWFNQRQEQFWGAAPQKPPAIFLFPFPETLVAELRTSGAGPCTPASGAGPGRD